MLSCGLVTRHASGIIKEASFEVLVGWSTLQPKHRGKLSKVLKNYETTFRSTLQV